MLKAIISLLAGLIFGIGLIISGMSNPAKVLNFLDLFGTWDPSLAFVMAGAVIVTFIGYKVVLKRPTPLLHHSFHIPTRNDADVKLVTGASIFGVGWGLGGFCPGPAFVALPLGSTGTLAFFPAMLIGMALAKFFSARHDKSQAPVINTQPT